MSKHGKSAPKKPPRSKLADRYPPDFAPKPTVFKGGIDRMIRIFEKSRDRNTGGYASGVLFGLYGKPSNVTSCSPWSGTVIGMLFDKDGREDGDDFEPLFDCDGEVAAGKGKPLPREFYWPLHQGDLGKKSAKALRAIFDERGWDTSEKKGANGACGSALFYNLAYRIDPKHMRRGDLIHMESQHWAEGKRSTGGHSAFVWDVHLNEKGEVDCFVIAGANGKKGKSGFTGYGVSVGCGKNDTLILGDRGSYKKKEKYFVDRDEFMEHGSWHVMPGTKKEDLKKELDAGTFKLAPVSFSYESENWGCFEVRAVRFWGGAPPAGQAGYEEAAKRKKWDMPASYITCKKGEGKQPVHFEKHKTTKVSGATRAKKEDAHKDVKPAPAQQPKDKLLPQQSFVETALQALFKAGWIAKDPGDPAQHNDARTRDAVKDFQQKFAKSATKPMFGEKKGPDGKAGKNTQAELKRQFDALRRGEPNPNAPPKETTPASPEAQLVYWAKNLVDLGEKVRLVVRGVNDAWAKLHITFTDEKTGKQESLTVEARPGGSHPFELPKSFAPGSKVTATVEAEHEDGAKVSKACPVPLHVAAATGGIKRTPAITSAPRYLDTPAPPPPPPPKKGEKKQKQARHYTDYKPADVKALKKEAGEALEHGDFASRALWIILGSDKYFETVNGLDGLTWGIKDFIAEDIPKLAKALKRDHPEIFKDAFAGHEAEVLDDRSAKDNPWWFANNSKPKAGGVTHCGPLLDDKGLIRFEWLRVGLDKIVSNPALRPLQAQLFLESTMKSAVKMFRAKNLKNEFSLALITGVKNSGCGPQQKAFLKDTRDEKTAVKAFARAYCFQQTVSQSEATIDHMLDVGFGDATGPLVEPHDHKPKRVYRTFKMFPWTAHKEWDGRLGEIKV